MPDCSSAGIYFDSGARPDVAAMVPSSSRSVLDVGCSHGGFASALKASRWSLETWGIDPDPTIEADATASLDHFIAGWFPADLPEGQRWDCITFVDSLEHFADPWTVLRDARARIAPGGCVVAAIPNTRHYSVAFPLLFRGRWEYADRGLLDRTHLRFFTKSSMISAFEDTGFAVEAIKPSSYRRPPIHQLLTLGGPLTAGLRAIHYLIRATPVGND